MARLLGRAGAERTRFDFGVDARPDRLVDWADLSIALDADPSPLLGDPAGPSERVLRLATADMGGRFDLG
jgi:hypothetical protein